MTRHAMCRTRCFLLFTLVTLFGVMLSGCDSADQVPRPSTASSNVTVIEQPFAMPGLDRNRTIRLYVPPDYANASRRYPVLYMHDGQNLFDDATSYVGEWGVDEILNGLAAAGQLELIVVGIDNGGEKRMNELSPWPNEEFGAAEGEAYLRFIVETVKPWVDSNYRTLPDRAHTGIMGSSMGGLISHAALLRYPEIFSKIGIFSPSYWYNDQVFADTDGGQLPADARLYFLIGREEGEDNVANMERMMGQLVTQGFPITQTAGKVVAGGEHNEGFWRSEFAAAVLWLYRD